MRADGVAMRLTGALVVAVAFGWLVGRSTTAQGQSSELACYELATQRSTLSDDQARTLCQNAFSVGPVACYDRARAATALTTDTAVELCLCADSDAPALCYERGVETTTVDTSEIFRMCAPTQQLLVPPGCRAR